MKLTTKQVCEMLNVTSMTVWQYRKGTPTKTALPYSTDGRNVYFDSKSISAWAKENGVTIAVPAKKLQSAGTAIATKVVPKKNRRRVHRRKPDDPHG